MERAAAVLPRRSPWIEGVPGDAVLADVNGDGPIEVAIHRVGGLTLQGRRQSFSANDAAGKTAHLRPTRSMGARLADRRKSKRDPRAPGDGTSPHSRTAAGSPFVKTGRALCFFHRLVDAQLPARSAAQTRT